MSIYEKLGVAPIINASGAVTRLGGAPMPPEVLEAFHAAALEHVALDQLHAVASQRIAAATGAEAGLVTAGAAAALTLGAAAILCEFDLGRMEQLPQTPGFPNQFVIAREQRSGYDHAIRAAGAVLVEVGFNEIVAGAGVRRTEAWEYQAAFGEQTAGVVYVLGRDSQPPLAEVVKQAHDAGLPVLVDAAGELPPRSNLVDIPGSGADLVAFSGGKAIRGPQSTGILCGRKQLIASAALQMLDMDDHFGLWDPPTSLIDKSNCMGIPRHGIGRTLKVSKEEIAALLTALDLFVAGAYDDGVRRMHRILAQIADSLDPLPLTAELIASPDGQTPPRLRILVQAGASCDALELCRQLRHNAPPIFVGHGELDQGALLIEPLGLQEKHAELIAAALRNILG